MIVIIGTGLAGYMLAKELRKLDQSTPVTLITAGEGSFYSKPLLSTALTSHKEAAQLAINTAQQMADQLQAQVLTHTVVEAIDPKNKTICFGNAELHYDQLVLACGAKPVSIPLHGDGLAEIITINQLEDYARFRQWLAAKKRIGVLGSGLVGCEFTNDLVNAGYTVEVIALDRYPLEKFVPEPIGCALQAALAEKGVQWHLQNRVVAVQRSANTVRVELANQNCISVDGVISAVGLQPNVDLARKANLTVNCGIVVNRYLETSDPNIFALGDCAEVSHQVKLYVAPLLQCARALAKRLTGVYEPVHYPAMPIVVKTPVCPVVTLPPPAVLGAWAYDGEGVDLRGLFVDDKQQLLGFALAGKRVQERHALTKQIPDVF